MAEEELEDLEEYHIKFPAPTPEEYEEFVFVYSGEKEPVVVLLGWAGCQDKYLAKYSSIYEDRGCITLRYTAPVVSTFFRHDKLPKLAARMVRLLCEMYLDDHPIFFHIFSNGGAFFYQHVAQELQRRNKALQIKGVIFDSAPGQRRFYSVYRALSAIVGGPQIVNTMVSLVLAFILTLFYIFMAYMKGLIQMKAPQTEPIVLQNEPCDWPQLFIYSKDDELVSIKDVEWFVGCRREKGIHVETLCFDTSPHVQHLITHREVYINTVVNFLQQCLKPNSEKSTQ